MSEPQPCGGFNWLNEEQVNNFDVMQVPDDSEIGYILEVDLEYPQELHEKHNDYPLAPEALNVTPDMLSTFSMELLQTLSMKPG